MEEVLLYLIALGFAFWLGWHVRGIVILANLATNPDKVIKMLEKIKEINEAEAAGKDTSEIEATEIAPERVGNMWYAYAADNDQFLGQGPTLEDALKMAAERFPNRKFWCKKPNEVSHNA